MDDIVLIKQYVKNRDERALEALIKRYLPSIYSYVRNYTGSEDNAADITQEVFVKVWKNINKFDQSKSFKTWIYTIAKNTAIDWLKKKNAIPFSAIETGELNFADFVLDKDISIFEQLLHNERTKVLATAIGRLPDHQSKVINLRIEKDLNFREISELLKIPINTVKSSYRRGVKLLEKLLTY